MARSRKTVGEKELQLLRYIADHQPATVREVADHAAATTGLARTTVLTVMERLRAKGFLRRRKARGVYRYECTVPRAELMRDLVGDFVDRVLDGSLGPFVAYLSESERLSEAELETLRALVAAAEAGEDDQ
jgi:predicted transcriptional regulator